MKRTLISSSLFIISFISVIALAQSSGGNFEVTKSSIDNGGGVSASGDFTLTGTIGQPDASRQPLTERPGFVSKQAALLHLFDLLVCPECGHECSKGSDAKPAEEPAKRYGFVIGIDVARGSEETAFYIQSGSSW